MSSKTCRQVTLAKNTVARVQRCTECDCVSIHIGPTTLRVNPHALEALWVVLGEAVASLHAHEKSKRLPLRGLA